MRVRRLYNYEDLAGNKHTNIVWFNSSGKRYHLIPRENVWNEGMWNIAKWNGATDDGHANPVLFSSSFSEYQQGVVDSLIQRLSVIRNELWYDYNYGLPLFEKGVFKKNIDAAVLKIIDAQPDVKSIVAFKSQVIGKEYSCDFTVDTKFGEIQISI